MRTLQSGSRYTDWDVDGDRGGDRIVSEHSNGTGDVKTLYCCPEKKTRTKKEELRYVSTLVSGFNFMLFYNEPLDCRDYRGCLFCLLFVE